MLFSTTGNAQNPVFKDTIVIDDNSITEKISYSASDSIFNDLKNRQVHLYGNAKITTSQINMTAGYILIDLNKREVYAKYTLDKDSIRTQFPKFSDGSEEINATSIRYNMNTKKGYIEELKIKQDEIHLYMGTAKRQANDEIHFINGRFTTCDLEEPHYHFQLSKAVMIPKKKIVTGPMNLWVAGIPTPLGLPFSIIPQQEKRTSGILFPEIVPSSSYGFGVQNLGYFIPINDYLQTSVYVNLYSRGSWGVRNVLNYAKKYGYRGSFDVGFQQFRSGFPTDTKSNKLSINWTHTKEAKSNPFWNFSSNVNFISDNQSKNNLDPLNKDYFNNSFFSDININRLFPGKPITTGMKISVRQNSISKTIALVAPVFNFNVTRFFPFKDAFKRTNGLTTLISKIGVTYNLEGQNKSTIQDTLLMNGYFKEIGNQFQNGFNQSVSVQTTTGFFKNTVKFTPSFNYTNKINFQQIEKSYNAATNSTKIDTLNKMGMANELNFSAQLTTLVYSYYKFIGKRQPLLRQIITPSIGFRYAPQVNELATAYAGVNQALITYSPFERSIYSSGTEKNSAAINFGINNTFELKRKSEKDTITGFKKTRLIDIFSITGNYDLFKDSMNLSDFTINLRVSPTTWLNFVANSNFTPYGWNTITGAKSSQYALSNGQGLGRFMNSSFTTTFTLTQKKSREELSKSAEIISSSEWNADYNYFALHPESLLNFNIPWKASFSHVYTLNRNTSKSASNPDEFKTIHTLSMTADMSFTKRWNIACISNYDFTTQEITNVRFTLSRNLHCWALSFNLTPIGFNKSFLFSIRNTSSIFQSAKLDIRKPPVFL